MALVTDAEWAWMLDIPSGTTFRLLVSYDDGSSPPNLRWNLHTAKAENNTPRSVRITVGWKNKAPVSDTIPPQTTRSYDLGEEKWVSGKGGTSNLGSLETVFV